MGQYIQTGLITNFYAVKPAKRSKSNLLSQQELIAKAAVDQPQIFECKEDKEYFTWTLKSTVKKKYLVNFLKRYYQDFYDSNTYSNHCKPVIDFLSTNPSQKALEKWDEDQLNDSFCLDDNIYREINIADKEIRVFISSYRLSIEGKVMYEELDGHLDFFEKCMRKAYADDPLGGCLIVEIG